MHPNKSVSKRTLFTVVLLIAVCSVASQADTPANAMGLWSPTELIPWVVGVYDEKPLSSEERAQLLHRLGFRKFAYFWEPDAKDIHKVEQEIEALQKYGIEPVAWWFSYDASDPFAKQLLETFKRYHIKPQLWMSPNFRDWML